MAGMDDYLTNASAPVTSPTAPQQMAVTPVDVPQQTVGAAPPGGFAANVKGPFGTKGTLGGILGTLEDIVLASSGLKPVYQPKIAAAKQADAISGWDSDPAGSYLKLASVAGVPAADEHLSNLMTGQYKTQLIQASKDSDARAQAAAPDALRAAQFKAQAPFYNLAASFKDPKTAANGGQVIRNRFAANGWDTSGLPADDSPDAWQEWAAQAVPAGQRATANEQNRHNLVVESQGQQRIDSQDRNIDSEITTRAGQLQIGRTNAATNQQNAGTNAARANEQARHNRVTEGQGQQRNDLKAAAPPVGYKNKNGLTFKGGDPNDRKNWS